MISASAISFSQDTLEDMVRKEKKEAREDVSEQQQLLPMQISSASGNLSICLFHCMHEQQFSSKDSRGAKER